jgi:transcriptional regulator with XRE-family HTH domain
MEYNYGRKSQRCENKAINDEVDKMKTNELIKMKRKEKGLTLRDIADVVGVSEGTVSRWESGDIKTMRRDKIEKLSRVLDIPPSVLLDWERFDEERIKRSQLLSELMVHANASKVEYIEIVLDLLKRLEALK